MIRIANDVGSAELKKYFEQLGQPHIVSDIRYGDFVFVGSGPNNSLVRIAVERKTWPDFLASTESNRFNGDQLIGLIENYDDVCLYLEGYSRCNVTTQMFEYQVNGVWTTGFGRARPWHAIKSMITTFERCGIKVDYPPSPLDTARYVSNLYQWYNSKSWDEHNSHKRVKEIKFDVKRPSKVIRVARALGLGHIAAEKADSVFTTVREMVNIDLDEWIKRGVVTTRAQATKVWKMCN